MGTLFVKNSKKVIAEKTERGLWDFSSSILTQNLKQLRGPFGEFFSKVSIPKKTKGALVSRHFVTRGILLRGKRKPFWLSSLGQMIQFGTIKFRITFLNTCF